MDEAAYRQYHTDQTGSPFNPLPLPNLTAAEARLYSELLRTNGRVEQEQVKL